jgi:hypothetical protein
MWEALWGIGTAALGVAILYGLYQYLTRNKVNDRVREEATRELYEHPRAYAKGGREALKRQLKD